MDQNLTTLEILGLAIKAEEDAAEFYQSVAKTVKNNLVAAKYESLALEEKKHREMLLNLYKKMTGEKSPPKIPKKIKTAESGFPVIALDSLEEVLEFAIAREEEAETFYKEGSKKTNDTNAKRTFEYLADIEHGHAVMLKIEVENYKKNRDWYANNPDIQLVGP